MTGSFSNPPQHMMTPFSAFTYVVLPLSSYSAPRISFVSGSCTSDVSRAFVLCVMASACCSTTETMNFWMVDISSPLKLSTPTHFDTSSSGYSGKQVPSSECSLPGMLTFMSSSRAPSPLRKSRMPVICCV